MLKPHPRTIARLVHFILTEAVAGCIDPNNITVQGFGFMRIVVDKNMRIHVWDSRLRTPRVSDIHDHAQWAFTSYVMSGELVNIRYDVRSLVNETRSAHSINSMPEPTHKVGIIKAGMGGGFEKDVGHVILTPRAVEVHTPWSSYTQEPSEVHRTYAQDGTVSLITQERTDVDTANVYWPFRTDWVDACPRFATRQEIVDVLTYALSSFNQYIPVNNDNPR